MAHLFVNPILAFIIGLGRVFRTYDNEEFGGIQTALQSIVELIDT